MPSDNDRLNMMVETMVPATRNADGRYLIVRLSFYPTHSTLNATDRPDVAIIRDDDALLVAQVAELISKARKRQKQEERQAAA